MNNKVSNIPTKIKNPLKFIKPWSSYKSILNKRLASRWDAFKLMMAPKQGGFIKTQMCKIGLSVSPGQNHKKKPEILTSKLSSLLSKKKKVCSSLKRLVDQVLVEYRDLRRQAREIGDKVRKQHFVDSLPVLRIRIRWIRKILASWIRICKNMRNQGAKYQPKTATKKNLLSKPQREIQQKRKMKKLLSSNSPKAAKLFWHLINKKPQDSSRIKSLNQVQF